MAFESLEVLSAVTGHCDIGNAISLANRDLTNAMDSFLVPFPCVVEHALLWSNNAAVNAFAIQLTSYVDGTLGTAGDCGNVIAAAGTAALNVTVGYPSESIAGSGVFLPLGSRVLVFATNVNAVAGDSGDSGFYKLVVRYSPETVIDSNTCAASNVSLVVT